MWVVTRTFVAYFGVATYMYAWIEISGNIYQDSIEKMSQLTCMCGLKDGICEYLRYNQNLNRISNGGNYG